MTHILITGATGRIGTALVPHLAATHDLRLVDHRPPAKPWPHPFVEADISDLAAMRELCRDIEVVVHLAAEPSPAAAMESLLPNNIAGTYNILQAAHEAGCQRVVFASTINVVADYDESVSIRTDMPVKPLNLYGASKAWGEAAGYVYASQLGLSVICLRFGWVQALDSPLIRKDFNHLDAIITYRDVVHLIERSILAPPDLKYGIFHGVSNNRYKRLDISDAREQLGYDPQDDAFALAGVFE